MSIRIRSGLAAFLISLSAVSVGNAAPNILIITCDNLGYGDLAIYNPESEIRTPRLDQFAAEGARMTSFYTASPTCTVSRACLLTGRIPQRHQLTDQLSGVAGNYGIGLSHDEILIPQVLKLAPSPYATACFGKWNVGFAPRSRPTERGFDKFIGHASGNADYYRHNYRERHDLYEGTEELHREGEYLTDIFADAAVDFIRRKSAGEKPWFIYLPFNAPHFPTAGNKQPGQPNIYQAPDDAFVAIGLKPDESDPRKRYAAVVHALDGAIGRVLDSLEDSGVTDETFVFFMSDNGAFRLDRKGLDVGINTPLREGGVTCWEGGLRVPALARWPGNIPAGSVVDEPFWSPDLLVACAELSGAPLPKKPLDGIDPLPILKGGETDPDRAFYFEYRKHAALRRGNWKIVRENPDEAWELYNLEKDISESEPVDHPAKLAELDHIFSDQKNRMARSEAFHLPEWIWHENTAAADAPFTLSFPLHSIPEKAVAHLRLAADFAQGTVWMGEQKIAEFGPYDPVFEIPISKRNSDDTEELRIEASGVEGPSALAASVLVDHADPYLTGSEGGFETPPFQSKGIVKPERWAANRLDEISPFAEYNQWKEASTADPESDALSALTKIPAGFEVDCLRVAGEDEGSWINIEINSDDEIFIAKEDKGILKMALGADGKIGKVEEIGPDLKECRGLLLLDDTTLFANANDSKALYRLTKSGNGGEWGEAELLRSTVGGSGHGRNDLAEGPDGSIHIIHGDSIEVPKEASRHTLGETGAPRELGHWIRTGGKGETWEILARGLRNPYGIAFNPEGEPFTYDADNEGDVGLPFYRPTRINHLVSGANYGWRQEEKNTRNMTVYAPDSWPTTFDVGRGSPTAVKFGTESNFPEKYQRALFALDWSYGRILAVDLIPRGASYYGTGEVFMAGRPLNVTDLEFASDGSMLFVTGGRKTKSALFRVRYTGEKATPKPKTTQESAREEFSAKARDRRRALEKWHRRTDVAPDELVWEELQSSDPWIRNAARVALEFSPVNTWRERASTGSLTAMLSLVRQGNDEDRIAVLKKLSEMESAPASPTDQLLVLQICENALGRESNPASANLPSLIGSILPSISSPVRKEACRLLAMLDAPKAVSRNLEAFSEATDQLDALHYLEVLSSIEKHWKDPQRKTFFRHLGHAERTSSGDRFMSDFFERIEKAALASIEDEEIREEMSTLLAENRESKSPPPPPQENRPFVKNWVLDDFSEEDLNASRKPIATDTGQALFSAALCNRCHVCGDTGFASGPDLTRVSSRFSRRDLLASIINPSQVVAEVHRNHLVTQKDGTTIQGRIVRDDFRKSLLYLSPNPFDPSEQIEINKNEIATYTESPISPMPPALLNTLTKEEILQLLTWIASGGQSAK